MVLTHTTNHTYSHPFPTVTLAFFLRYCSPQLNPFAQHVLSTDTISSHVDQDTGRLHTTRIHLKKSRMPKAVLKLLPASMTGGVADKASYILETSVIDMHEGWMRTESRNLNFTGILSVVEQQVYTALPMSPEQQMQLQIPPQGEDPEWPQAQSQLPQQIQEQQQMLKQHQEQLQLQQQLLQSDAAATTGVETTVVFRSRLGEKIRERIGQGQQRYQQQIQQFKELQLQKQQQQQQQQPDLSTSPGEETYSGWFGSGWISGIGAKGIQRTIEVIASTKTQDQLGKSREGMSMILERLRQTGIMGVLELRRRAMEGSLEALEIA